MSGRPYLRILWAVVSPKCRLVVDSCKHKIIGLAAMCTLSLDYSMNSHALSALMHISINCPLLSIPRGSPSMSRSPNPSLASSLGMPNLRYLGGTGHIMMSTRKQKSLSEMKRVDSL
jgi:hypothetical protein